MNINFESQSDVFDILDAEPFVSTAEAEETEFKLDEEFPKSICGQYIPVVPNEREKRRLRYFYSKAAIAVLLAFILAGAFEYALTELAEYALKAVNGGEHYAGGYDALLSATALPGILVNMGTMLFPLLAAFFVGCRSTGLRPREFLERRKKVSLPMCLVHTAAAFCLILLIDEYSLMIANNLELEYAGMSFPKFSDIQSLAAWGICYIIAMPICEELFFRGFLLKNLSRANYFFGIVMSSIFYGLFMRNIWQAVPALALGVTLGLLALRGGSVRKCIAVHSAIYALLLVTQYVRELVIPDRDSFLWFGLLFIPLLVAASMYAELLYESPAFQYGYHHKTRGFAVAMTLLTLDLTIMLMFYEMCARTFLA